MSMVNESRSESTRISAEETLRLEGYKSVEEYIISEDAQDSIQPACCRYGCTVEPDGECPHGNPSVLIALGVI